MAIGWNHFFELTQYFFIKMIVSTQIPLKFLLLANIKLNITTQRGYNNFKIIKMVSQLILS